MNLVIAFALGAILPPATNIAVAMVVGFFAYGVSLVLFIVAMRHVGTARADAYFSIAPFFGAILAVILGASVTIILVLAALLMAVGVWLHLTERHEHEHHHEAITHDHWHVHVHTHGAITHSHEHYPDAHHRHGHKTVEIIQPRLYSQWMLTIASRIDVLTRLGRAMADPSRARILVSLLDSPGYPARMAYALDLTRSNVSNHLACLRGCGLVVAVPEGRQTRYDIADPHLTRAISALTEVVLAVDDAAPCTDDTCTVPGC